MNSAWGCTVVLVALILASIAAPAAADRLDRALDDLGWYDADNQSLRHSRAENLADPKSPREWVWKERPNKPARNWNFPNLPPGLGKFLEYFVWALIAAAAIWLAIFIWRTLRDAELQPLQGKKTASSDQGISVDRLAELPFDTPRASGDLLAAIRDRYAQGQYGDAIALYFAYQLLKLDQSHVIRLLKGKTNRQYAREIAKHHTASAGLQDIYTHTMVTFEDYFFGNHAISQESFEACWSELDTFHSLLGVPT